MVACSTSSKLLLISRLRILIGLSDIRLIMLRGEVIVLPIEELALISSYSSSVLTLNVLLAASDMIDETTIIGPILHVRLVVQSIDREFW